MQLQRKELDSHPLVVLPSVITSIFRPLGIEIGDKYPEDGSDSFVAVFNRIVHGDTQGLGHPLGKGVAVSLSLKSSDKDIGDGIWSEDRDVGPTRSARFTKQVAVPDTKLVVDAHLSLWTREEPIDPQGRVRKGPTLQEASVGCGFTLPEAVSQALFGRPSVEYELPQRMDDLSPNASNQAFALGNEALQSLATILRV